MDFALILKVDVLSISVKYTPHVAFLIENGTKTTLNVQTEKLDFWGKKTTTTSKKQIYLYVPFLSLRVMCGFCAVS